MVRSSSSVEPQPSSSSAGLSAPSKSQTDSVPLESLNDFRRVSWPGHALSSDRENFPNDFAKQATGRSKQPSISWLTQVWLAKDFRHERIATAGPRLGVAIIGQSLLEQHLELLPGLKGPADFISVRDERGHIGYRAKMHTWPLLKRETIKVREFAL